MKDNIKRALAIQELNTIMSCIDSVIEASTILGKVDYDIPIAGLTGKLKACIWSAINNNYLSKMEASLYIKKHDKYANQIGIKIYTE